MKINKLFTIFTLKYALNLLGFLLLSYFLWYRFIRERLPKNIPFELTEIGFYILIIICCTYIYILLRIIKPKPPNELLIILSQFLNKFYIPWFILEETIKNNYYIKKIYPEMLVYFPSFIKHYKTVSEMYYIYMILYIIPRIILLLLFCIDIFYFHKIEYTYKFSFLILYILLSKYAIYSIKKTTEECITYLDTWYVVEIISEDTNEDSDYYMPINWIDYIDYSTSGFDAKFGVRYQHLTIEKFLNLQASAIKYKNTLYSYISIPRPILIEKYAFENNLDFNYVLDNKEFDPIISKDFYELMPILLYLCVALENYEFIDKHHDAVKRFNLITVIVYLICWAYILIISFKFELLITMLNILDKIEPFSGIYL